MKAEEHLYSFVKLGEKIKNLNVEEMDELCMQAASKNPWFIKESVISAFKGLAQILEAEKLADWYNNYSIASAGKNVGVVMAGNIPMAGFHDFLCVLMSNNNLFAKLSTEDSILLQRVAEWLSDIEPRYKERICFAENLRNMDAVIATGNNNSAKYFNFYFSKIPHIIRKNRNSIAVISGDESKEDLKNLGRDILTYYGLGCRSVSKLYVPENYTFDNFFESIETYSDIGFHHKYANNYDYNKSIYLLNQTPFLDNGFLMIKEDRGLISPISVVFFEKYKSLKELEILLQEKSDQIQCIVSELAISGAVKIGKAQYPSVADYADKVDTMLFLTTI
jgi:hypothetical protein